MMNSVHIDADDNLMTILYIGPLLQSFTSFFSRRVRGIFTERKRDIILMCVFTIPNYSTDKRRCKLGHC